MRNLMLDLETLGNNNNSVIIQIGACFFDAGSGKIGKTFSMNVDPSSCMRYGMEVDAQTIYWWMEQSDEARRSVMAKPLVDIKEALEAFSKYAKKAERVWSHATFDHVILLNAFRRVGLPSPFHYRAAKDIRTLTALAGLKADVSDAKVQRNGIPHNALDDAIYQVSYVVECLHAIKARS